MLPSRFFFELWKSLVPALLAVSFALVQFPKVSIDSAVGPKPFGLNPNGSNRCYSAQLSKINHYWCLNLPYSGHDGLHMKSRIRTGLSLIKKP